MLELQQTGGDVFIAVVLQPRASRNAVIGLHGNALKIAVTAPPVEGAANEACLRWLAQLIGVSRSHLTLVKGAKSRRKLIRIEGTSIEAVHARLKDLIPNLER